MNNKSLGVNIDHVATLRNARGGKFPDPIEYAKQIIPLGISNITMHLREDRRHIVDNDVISFLSLQLCPLNLELGANETMVNIALRHTPAEVCFVPENRRELTTEGGLNLDVMFALPQWTRALQQKNTKVFYFVEPTIQGVKMAKTFGADGVELHTGYYANATNISEKQTKLEAIMQSAIMADSIGLAVHAGHGLTLENIQPILQSEYITGFNIGHYLIGLSLYIGAEVAIQKMLRLIK